MDDVTIHIDELIVDGSSLLDSRALAEALHERAGGGLHPSLVRRTESRVRPVQSLDTPPGRPGIDRRSGESDHAGRGAHDAEQALAGGRHPPLVGH